MGFLSDLGLISGGTKLITRGCACFPRLTDGIFIKSCGLGFNWLMRFCSNSLERVNNSLSNCLKNEKNTIILRCYTMFGSFDRKYWLLFWAWNGLRLCPSGWSEPRRRRGYRGSRWRKFGVGVFSIQKNRAELSARFFAFYAETSGNKESSRPLTGSYCIPLWTQHALWRLAWDQHYRSSGLIHPTSPLALDRRPNRKRHVAY